MSALQPRRVQLTSPCVLPSSLHFRSGRLEHLAALDDFGAHQLVELLRRARLRDRTRGIDALAHFLHPEDAPDLGRQLVDDGAWRARWRKHAEPTVVFETGHRGFVYRGNVLQLGEPGLPRRSHGEEPAALY